MLFKDLAVHAFCLVDPDTINSAQCNWSGKDNWCLPHLGLCESYNNNVFHANPSLYNTLYETNVISRKLSVDVDVCASLALGDNTIPNVESIADV